MNLLDESGEIKATAFRDEVDKYYDMLEVNKVRKRGVFEIHTVCDFLIGT